MSARPRKNPLLVSRRALLPPGVRSREALGLAVAAAEGRFALQVCGECATVQYPPREACHACLSDRLAWRDVSPLGRLVASSTVRITADPYFRQRTPWRIGTVKLECGPVAIAHLHADVADGAAVRMALRLDKAGQGVMLALPMDGGLDERMRAEMSGDPTGRRVLVSDVRGPVGQAMARAMVAAGAAEVFAGVADAWKPFPGQDDLGEGVAVVPLDVGDATSVRELAASLGGRVDILVNTGLQLRAGGLIERGDVVLAREEMEAAYFGPLRLAQAFGPALRGRGGDGAHAAVAWVNLVSAQALGASPGFGAQAAAQAAALALSHGLRAELRPVRVLTALLGPLDDDWHQDVPPPKLSGAAVATAVIAALRGGLEEIAIGDVAQDVVARWKDNPALLARERASG